MSFFAPQAYFLAQTSTRLHLLESSNLKQHTDYSSQTMSGVLKDTVKKLNGVEVIGVLQKPIFVQLYDDQKSMELLRVKRAAKGNGKIEYFVRNSLFPTFSANPQESSKK